MSDIEVNQDDEILGNGISSIEPLLNDGGNGGEMVSENGVHHLEKATKEKPKYPKSVFFIVSNEFCERFSYYGMRGVLALYLKSALSYSESDATIVYHVFVMLCYFTPLFGGIIADSWLGKYKTIIYLSMLYAFGNIVLSFGSIEAFNIPHKELSLLGLFLIATGTGGIKPCVSSFGGDQFVLPQQERQLQQFFSIFYFAINGGSVISSFLTPLLREYHCLGSNTDCYPLAFGLPAVLMVVALVIFVLGSSFYKRNQPQGNIVLQVGGCVSHAIVKKMRSNEKRKEWLDYADDKYSTKLIADIKVLMKLVYLFSPTIVFWALFEQQGSKWTFQASRMNGDLGSFKIQPDQMQTLNAVLVLIFIPLFESVVYPMLEKLRLARTPLQKLVLGGFLSALAFLVSGAVELRIMQDNPIFPESGQSGIQIYNPLNCSAHIIGIPNTFDVPSFGFVSLNEIPSGQLNLTISSLCASSWEGTLQLKEKEISSFMLLSENKNISLFKLNMDSNDMVKSKISKPKLKIIYNGLNSLSITIQTTDNLNNFTIGNGMHQTNQSELHLTGRYSVSVNNELITDITLNQGGIYTLMLGDDTNKMKSQLLTVVKPNSVNILWQIPQYVIMTSAEIMFSITGLEFSYSESPQSMKSVISSVWLMTNSFGNILVLIIAGFKMANAAYEMFIFSGLMSTVMLFFIYLACQYTYAAPSSTEKEDKDQAINVEQTRI